MSHSQSCWATPHGFSNENSLIQIVTILRKDFVEHPIPGIIRLSRNNGNKKGMALQ